MIELHTLLLSQNGFDTDLEAALGLLDSGELARYRRFNNVRARACFLQARRMVKVALAAKLDVDAASLSFAYGDTDKPYLADFPEWHFNISHCQDAIVVAIAPFAVGVDVENISRCARLCPRAADFLSPAAAAEVALAAQAEAVFATHWTCIEAYTKLKGSAIYREKDRVHAVFAGGFEAGRRYRFEDCAFTVFEQLPDLRLSVASHAGEADILWLDWPKGGSVRYHLPCVQ